MPLQLINLDDKGYADLVQEARSLIPTYAPEWTDHNPSDPGITLVELFAYLSELLIYRLNRVTATNVLSFLKLLNGTDWNPFEETQRKLTDAEKAAVRARLAKLSREDLAQLIADQLPKTVQNLRRLERAVTPADFEALAIEAGRVSPGQPDSRVARAHCLPRRNLEMDPERDKAANVSVIILPKADPEPDLPGLLTTVFNYLEPKLPLTTQLHVVGPQFVTFNMKATVVILPDEPELESQLKDPTQWLPNRIVAEVKAFFDPRPRADGSLPWPFGRNVFVSELYGLLDSLSGVDYIQDITLTPANPARLLTGPDGSLIGVEVKPYELVDVRITKTDITIIPADSGT